MLLSPAWSSAATAEPAVASVVAGLARPAPARVPFAEIRILHVMDRPLLSRGELAWLGQGHLQRKVLQPQPGLVDIAGDQVTLLRQGRAPRTFSLHRAPELQLVLKSFNALLEGDAVRLQQSFQATLQSRPQGSWTLDLVPRDENLRSQILHIAMDGAGRQIRCMRIEQPHGDRSIELFGALAAKLGASPQPDALLRLCQSAD